MNKSESIYNEIKNVIKHNSHAVVVKILSTEGSSPGKAGCLMLVRPDKSSFGTIGGGELEKFCINLASEVYKTKKGFIKEFCLDSSKSTDVSMICGGNVKVEFKIFEKQQDKELIDFLDLNIRKPRALIFGGGHVGSALCPVLSNIGFEVYIIDDRTEFASKEMHQEATECIKCDYNNVNSSVEITENDYVIIMTHGHSYDREVLLQTCRTKATYIGCIGSHKKVEATQQFLRENGIPENVIQKIKSPIGLPIGGNSPQEIAISIAAQLIQHRYQYL